MFCRGLKIGLETENYYYYYYKRSNLTPMEEPKDYKTPKSPKGSKQDHQENKEEKIYINWIEYKLEIKETV